MQDEADRIAQQVRDLISYAKQKAEEEILENTKELANIAFGPGDNGMYICMPGVDSKNKDNNPPLTVEVRDIDTGEALFLHDPVLDLLDCYGDNPPEAIHKIESAIAHLEAGILRLRNEAERLKTQS